MIGFTRLKDGQRFVLLGSHYSTAPVGQEPFAKPGCAGCDRDGARQRGDGLSGSGPLGPPSPAIAQTPSGDLT
jgi:hypothetical protein